ncbi:MAG: SDR family oxidoreductase [Longimicrobiales bacterium]
MNVLVTGATGYIGGRLVPRLLEAGHSVRVLVRDPDRLKARPWTDRVDILRGDVGSSERVAEAVRGMDAAYYLVHAMCSGPDFARTDRKAAEGFARGAHGVGQVIYLGGILPGNEAIANSKHLQSRAEVGEILRENLPTTELRAGPIIGSGSASFEMVRYLTERLPVMVAPRWIKNEVQPISVRDVLSYLVAVLGREDALGVIDVGTDPLTFKEMMLGYARVRGLPRSILPLPVLAPGLAALWVGLVTPIPNCLAVPLVRGMVRPVVGDRSRATTLFPHIRPLPYQEAVKLAVEMVEHQDVQTRWSDALGTGETFRLEDREGLVREVRTRLVNASQEDVFRSFSSLGGETGWLVWRSAWWLRGFLDQLVGGPGLRRGRRHATELLVGEALDFWRVEEVDPPTLLRLRAEMKVPGEAWLQFETRREGDRTRLIQAALFAPTGFFGWLYWYGSYPLHAFIFNAMVDALARRAEDRSLSI